MSSGDFVRVVVSGGNVPPGEIDLDTLAPLAKGLLRALRATARSDRGEPIISPGQPSRHIRRASGLRLIGIEAGSTVLVWRSAEEDLFGGIADETVRGLVGRIQGEVIESAILTPLEEARRSLGEDGRIEFRTPWTEPVVLDERAFARLSGASETAVPSDLEWVEISGWLHGADLAPDQIRIRDARGVDWVCHYPDDLEITVRSLLGHVVIASGLASSEGRGRRIELETLTGADDAVSVLPPRRSSEFLEWLTEQQGISSSQPLSALRGNVDEADPNLDAFSAMFDGA
jgi:hypothetical protein